MDSSLPFDVVENIISRAPIESLLQCKPTCKELYALCNDKRFMYKHLELSEERLMRVYGDKVEIFNPATLDLLCLPVPPEFHVTFTNMIVIHCNGLLLCRWCTGFGPGYSHVAVWNPVLGHLRFVESGSHCLSDFYGFGYDNVSCYKILSIKSCILWNAIAELGRLLMYEAACEWLVSNVLTNHVVGEIMSLVGAASVELIYPIEPIAVVPLLRVGLAEHASSVCNFLCEDRCQNRDFSIAYIMMSLHYPFTRNK
ncbi:unnamed protein product [Arabis nemorensis]|uniref:F-box domain-containing protein n=1 Tax=Arabis nemorensis TaxID=586526 RepID=A0A565AZ29_9BRAS|nr:unnamed protein product [Arabis nemorensis]